MTLNLTFKVKLALKLKHFILLFKKRLTFNYTFKLELYIDHLLDQWGGGGVDGGGTSKAKKVPQLSLPEF